jgi:hypothetical protein
MVEYVVRDCRSEMSLPAPETTHEKQPSIRVTGILECDPIGIGDAGHGWIERFEGPVLELFEPTQFQVLAEQFCFAFADLALARNDPAEVRVTDRHVHTEVACSLASGTVVTRSGIPR